MFEARNQAASRLLVMVRRDRHRSHLLAGAVHAVMDQEAQSKTSPDTWTNILMSSGAIIAALTALTKVAPTLAPEGVEDTGILEKGKEWIEDIFKSKAEKQVDDEAVGTQVGPSPMSNPDDVKANRVKTAKADESTMDAIRKTAFMQKIDYALLYAVAGAESSFRKDADVATSSAVGLFQFTVPTWKWLVDKYKLDFTLEDRKDPQKSAFLASLYLREITKTLTKALGRKPSYSEVYMGYFMGPGGATQFLKALQRNPDAIGADLFPKAAASNPWVFYSKDKKPLTLLQIMGKQEGKIVSYAQDANAQNNRSASAEQAPSVQVTPESQASQSSRAVPSSFVVPTASPGQVKQPVIAVQSARDVSSGYSERAPAVQEKPAQQQTGGQSGAAVLESAPPPANTTIVRGRDKRLYMINQ